jgi:hypothetical protein
LCRNQVRRPKQASDHVCVKCDHTNQSDRLRTIQSTLRTLSRVTPLQEL